MTVSTAVMAAAVVAFAMTVRGMTGFGSSLIAVPLLVHLIDLKVVVPLTALMGAPNSIGIAWKERDAIDWKVIAWIMPFQFIGVCTGAHLLAHFATAQLKFWLAAVITVFAVRILASGNGELKDLKPVSRAWGPLVGLAGGTIAGVFGAGGPPAVIYLTHVLPDKRSFRATISALFATGEWMRVFVYITSGLATATVWHWAALIVPVSLIGTYIGHHAQQRISETHFRKLIAAVLIASVAGFFWKP